MLIYLGSMSQVGNGGAAVKAGNHKGQKNAGGGGSLIKGDQLSSSIKKKIASQQSMPEMSLEDIRAKREAGESIASSIRDSLKGKSNPGVWLRDGAFQLAKLEDFGVGDSQLSSQKTVKDFYKKMSRQFHPDKGGTAEQMANLNTLRKQMSSISNL